MFHEELHKQMIELGFYPEVDNKKLKILLQQLLKRVTHVF